MYKLPLILALFMFNNVYGQDLVRLDNDCLLDNAAIISKSILDVVAEEKVTEVLNAGIFQPIICLTDSFGIPHHIEFIQNRMGLTAHEIQKIEDYLKINQFKFFYCYSPEDGTVDKNRINKELLKVCAQKNITFNLTVNFPGYLLTEWTASSGLSKYEYLRQKVNQVFNQNDNSQRLYANRNFFENSSLTYMQTIDSVAYVKQYQIIQFPRTQHKFIVPIDLYHPGITEEIVIMNGDSFFLIEELDVSGDTNNRMALKLKENHNMSEKSVMKNQKYYKTIDEFYYNNTPEKIDVYLIKGNELNYFIKHNNINRDEYDFPSSNAYYKLAVPVWNNNNQ